MAVWSVPVNHCHDAHGLVMDTWCGNRIVYSGDTRPCDALVRAGKGATLLVHEATFDDARAEHARRKRHSTTSEALGVGARMGCIRCVLTHFSQRYPCIIDNVAAQGEEQEGSEGAKGAKMVATGGEHRAESNARNVFGASSIRFPWCVAFDGMRIRLGGRTDGRVVGDVEAAAQVLPAIRAHFDAKEAARDAVTLQTSVPIPSERVAKGAEHERGGGGSAGENFCSSSDADEARAQVTGSDRQHVRFSSSSSAESSEDEAS